MSVEITIKAPHGTALHEKITELLVVGITPVAATAVSVAEVVEASDLPRSPTLADAIHLRRVAEIKEQKQPAGLMNNPVYEKAFTDEIQQVFSETASEPKRENDGDFLQRLGTDASQWADEFLNMLRYSHHAPTTLEKITMIGWFANAIEAGRSAGLAAQKDKPESAGYVRAFETDDDPHTDAARNAQQEHLDEAANLASSAQWQRENSVLDHLRSFVSTGDLNIGIRTVINGGFIVVSTTYGETEKSVTDLVSCTSPAELLSAIALICAFAEHG